MNQILVTKKLYVTPDLKVKKKFYKFDFFLSIFLVCALFSFYIYAEVDKTKSEAVSQDILQNLEIHNEDIVIDNTIMRPEDNLLIVILDDDNSQGEEINLSEFNIDLETHTSESGDTYTVVGTIEVPKLDIYYPIISKSTTELLKNSICKLWGPEPNEIGNLCLVGHNYRNNKFFSKASTLENGDELTITNRKGKKIVYTVYDKFEVQPENTECTSQLTKGKREVTLITCTSDSQRRTVIKATQKF